MARGLDAVQKTELVEFLEELLRAGEYKTQAQWARDAGYHPVNLSNALNRSNLEGLDGYSLLKLIRAAAVRAESAPDALARRVAADGRVDEAGLRLAALEAKVDELPTAEDLGSAVATLQAAIDRLATANTPAVQPAKPARRSASKR